MFEELKKMDPKRVCFQKIGGLLVETNAKDSVQNLEKIFKENIEPSMQEILKKKKYLEEQLQDLEEK